MVYQSCGDYMIAKLVSDHRFEPSYTKERATRLYQICYKKCNRGYVRASTEKILYRADQCFWRQFWPTEVFPREKPRNAGCEKKGKALEKGGAAAHTKQEETRNRQNETTESLLPQSSSHVEQLPNMTKLGEQSLSNLNIASRDRSMTTGGGRRVDWGILAIQRRKEYRRQQKQKLLKKKTAKGSAQVLAKYPSKVSTLGEHPLVHHKELERPRLAYSTTQLQRSHTAHKLVATSLHKEDSNPHRESRRLPEDVQLRTAPSSGRLQTLDEMIKEEAEIARKKNIERYTSEFGLEEVASGNNQASDWHSRFCLVL